MHRFFISPEDLNKDHFKSTDKELCHQLSKVLKMRPGKKVILLDNSETVFEAEWTTVSRSICEATIISKTSKTDIGSQKPVHLFVPPLKNQSRWELILEKGTELGVSSFTPLITERTEVEALRKLDRLHRIIQEAAEQSGRTKLPLLHQPTTFKEILSTIDQSPSTNLIASLYKGAKTTQEILPKAHKAPNNQATPIGVYIGPVGDFTEEEVQQAVEHKFYPITLGTQILRTETAAIASACLILLSS